MKISQKSKPIDSYLRVNKTGSYKLRFHFVQPCKKRHSVEIGLHTREKDTARERAVIFLRMLHCVNAAGGGVLGLIHPMDKCTLSLAHDRKKKRIDPLFS